MTAGFKQKVSCFNQGAEDAGTREGDKRYRAAGSVVDHDDIGLDDIEQECAPVLTVLVDEGMRREQLELRVVVLRAGASAEVEEREEKFYLVVLEDLMRLGQKG